MCNKNTINIESLWDASSDSLNWSLKSSSRICNSCCKDVLMFVLLFKVADDTVQQNNCPGDCFDNFGFNIGTF